MTFPSIPEHTVLDDFNTWAYDHNTLGFLVWLTAFMGAIAVIVLIVLLLVALASAYFNRGRKAISLWADEWKPTESHWETVAECSAALRIPTTRRIEVVDQWTRKP